LLRINLPHADERVYLCIVAKGCESYEGFLESWIFQSRIKSIRLQVWLGSMALKVLASTNPIDIV